MKIGIYKSKQLRETLCSQVRVSRVDQAAYTIAPIVRLVLCIIDGKSTYEGR